MARRDGSSRSSSSGRATAGRRGRPPPHADGARHGARGAKRHRGHAVAVGQADDRQACPTSRRQSRRAVPAGSSTIATATGHWPTSTTASCWLWPRGSRSSVAWGHCAAATVVEQKLVGAGQGDDHLGAVARDRQGRRVGRTVDRPVEREPALPQGPGSSPAAAGRPGRQAGSRQAGSKGSGPRRCWPS